MKNSSRHRRRALSGATAAMAAGAIALALGAPTAAAAPRQAGGAAPTYTVPRRAGEALAVHDARQKAVRYLSGGKTVTRGPDPRLSLTRGTSPGDAAGWAATSALRSKQRAAQRSAQVAAAAAPAQVAGSPRVAEVAAAARSGQVSTSPLSAQVGAAARRSARGPAARLTVNEAEPAGTRGANDTIAKAQGIWAFGTAAGRSNAADLAGRLSAAAAPSLVRQSPNVEDDGTADVARDTGVSGVRRGFTTTGAIGDAPRDASGARPDDLDWYATDLKAGELLDVSLDVSNAKPVDVPFLITILDADQNYVADSFFSSPDWEQSPRLEVPIAKTGRYFVVILAFTSVDDTSGKAAPGAAGVAPVTVTPGTGSYTIGISARSGDTDVFRVQLKAGDVLGANIAGAASIVGVSDAGGTDLMRSAQDATSIMPAVTPLPGGGNAVADIVAPRDGAYFVSVLGGDGAYTANLEAYRPGGEGKSPQVIYLDYDGARVNTRVWGGRGVTTLSPLSAFVPKWGLKSSDRAALGRVIKETVVENLNNDLRASGLSNSVSVRVVTSDEFPDLWGRPNVTRVIVGGTTVESGIDTIGIAESIDPGDFDREESALVLLDALSGSPDEFGEASLNSYLSARSKTLPFVGRAVGNVVSHEAGHMLGNWHTDNENTTASVMDAGGSFSLLYGVGRDGVGGTSDDTDTDFVTDTYDLVEGFSGRENTTAKTAWALSR